MVRFVERARGWHLRSGGCHKSVREVETDTGGSGRLATRELRPCLRVGLVLPAIGRQLCAVDVTRYQRVVCPRNQTLGRRTLVALTRSCGSSMREINLSSRRTGGKTARLLSFALSSESVISP